MIKSNYVAKLTFATIDSQASFHRATQMGGQGIIELITAAKLRGCGGAGFPTGKKLALLAQEEAQPKYIICNADEGEPGTFKDRELLTNYAPLIFTGMAIAGGATGSSSGILYLRAEYSFMHEHLLAEIQKCKKVTDFTITIKSGAGAYVCGEESALLESLESKRGEPRNRPPFPIQSGYLGQPSAVNNVETFAWLTTIISKGAQWFNAVGTEQSAGYKVFSVSGDCRVPGIYEFPLGTTVAEMLKIVGGVDAQAVQLGGAAGQTLPRSEFMRKIAFEDASPGGAIIVFGPERNMFEVAENFLEFFVSESCGQCTPCRKGNLLLLAAIRKIRAGHAEGAAWLADLYSLAQTMQMTSKCGFGQCSPNIFLAVTKYFSNEIQKQGAHNG